jgi:hypothetical protein
MSHYDWLQINFPIILSRLGLEDCGPGIFAAHGDKGYGYRAKWAEAGIPFDHAMATYLLGRLRPYSQEMRLGTKGWVDVGDWVIATYRKIHAYFPDSAEGKS